MRKCVRHVTAEHRIHPFMLTHELLEMFQISCLGYKTGDTECCNDVDKSFQNKKSVKNVFCPNLSYLSKFFPPSMLNY